MDFLPHDWSSVFEPDVPLLENIARGIVLYFFILLVFRFLPRRTAGELGAMDLVFVLLLTEAASHALGDYDSVGDGIIMFLVIILCNYLVNWLSYTFPLFENLFEHSPIQIVKEGRLHYRNMRKELITKDEFISHMRENGIENIEEIKSAHVESEGQISFIRYDKESQHSTLKKKREL